MSYYLLDFLADPSFAKMVLPTLLGVVMDYSKALNIAQDKLATGQKVVHLSEDEHAIMKSAYLDSKERARILGIALPQGVVDAARRMGFDT